MAEAKNPYQPRVLELSAALDALRGAPIPPMFSEEEIAARRAQQRRDEEIASLAKLSGQKELGAWAGVMLPEALNRAKPKYTEHGEFDPLSGDLRVFPEYDRRIKEQRLERDLGAAEMKSAGYDQQVQNREDIQQYNQRLKDAQAALAEERARQLREKAITDAKKVASGKTLTGQVYKDLKQAGEDYDTLQTITKTFATKFKPETSKGFARYGALQDTLAREAGILVPEQWLHNREAWADLQRMKEMKARYALFGATLTGNEKTSWETVTPPRGSSREELDRWFTDQHTLISKAIASMANAAAAGGWNKKQIEEYTRGIWKAPSRVYVPGTGFVEVE